LRNIAVVVALALISSITHCWPQKTRNLQTYFKEYVGLSNDEITAIRSGKPIAKNLRSRTPAEIFVFGAVYVNATPDAYVNFSTEFDRLRKLSGYLAINKFSSPPQLDDLEGFAFDRDEINSLKKCKPSDCDIQMPETSIQNLKKIDWYDPNVLEHVNRLLKEAAIRSLGAYQQDGNATLGIYRDKEYPTDVAKQFRYILSYARALPEYLPDFYNYLLSYPRQKPQNVDDSFYWAKVKFGLKPTLRVVHLMTMRGKTDVGPAYAIAEKQLYSSHYFQTALDLTYCIPDTSGAGTPGFYLIKVMGSEQAGLTGFKGSIVRKVAVDRSASTLQKSLAAIKNALEHDPKLN
jgi:hypothetical protein